MTSFDLALLFLLMHWLRPTHRPAPAKLNISVSQCSLCSAPIIVVADAEDDTGHLNCAKCEPAIREAHAIYATRQL